MIHTSIVVKHIETEKEKAISSIAKSIIGLVEGIKN